MIDCNHLHEQLTWSVVSIDYFSLIAVIECNDCAIIIAIDWLARLCNCMNIVAIELVDQLVIATKLVDHSFALWMLQSNALILPSWLLPLMERVACNEGFLSLLMMDVLIIVQQASCGLSLGTLMQSNSFCFVVHSSHVVLEETSLEDGWMDPFRGTIILVTYNQGHLQSHFVR